MWLDRPAVSKQTVRKKLTYLAFFKQAITSGGSSLEVELVDIVVILK